MKCIEYIRLVVDTGDLDKLCELGSIGWEIKTSKPTTYGFELILARELEGKSAERTINYYYEKASK